MASVNEQLRDADISHAVDLQKYSNGVVRRLIAILNRADADLFAQLVGALERLPAESFTVERLETLLTSVRFVNARAYEAIGLELRDELKGLTEYEAGFQYQLFRSVIPEVLPIARMTVDLAYTAALSRPFQGRLLAEWSKSIEADRMTRIRDAVRMGYVEQQTTSQIVARVRGTRAKGYADGIIEIDRRNAESVVRTAISHTAATTREGFHKENGDLIKAVSWSATLDSRTSPICRIRDGKRYTNETHKPIGHSLPWLGGPGKAHWGCRSSSVPITKSWAELGGAVDLPEFTPSQRASMDGTVPAETTFADWIKRQSAARQDEVLGPARGKLMRQGGLTLDRFYNDKGSYLSLDQLRERDAAAFSKAGL
ncbi:hypothetical protein J7E62_27665 [Variovorax paradoxus]|nr:hypothetical protein [Variovorax paradoxus]